MNTNILDPEIIAEARDLLGDRYIQSLGRFAEQGRDRLARIKFQIENHGDTAIIAFEAHSLKSSSACLGAVDFPVVAGQMEMAARAMQSGEAHESLMAIYDRMSKSFNLLISAFSDL